LWAEVVRIAYHLHWSLDTVLDLEHPVRRRVLLEIEALRAQPSASPSARPLLGEDAW
jgi:hypothetical protein